MEKDTRPFQWTEFYEKVADKLLEYQDQDRRALLAKNMHEIGSRRNFSYLQDKFADGSTGPLEDICPFTVLGTFNRGTRTKIADRQAVAADIAHLLDVRVPIPESFEGIPVLFPTRSRFFSDAREREDSDIDALWSVFVAASQLDWHVSGPASRFIDPDEDGYPEEFIVAYNAAQEVRSVGWNLSIGLYWAHPWDFLPLDKNSREYIRSRLELEAAPRNGGDYLLLCSAVKGLLSAEANPVFSVDNSPVRSIPELSLDAWNHTHHKISMTRAWNYKRTATDTDNAPGEQKPEQIPASLEPYSVSDILKDGCFLDQSAIERLLERLHTKKNLILQGPPGTGKTWLARRLAFALMGEKDTGKLRAVQFHPNLSYEDFVRGWRPTSDGQLTIVDGVFMEAICTARENPSSSFVVVIEEINRGNPAQIFGELLTLLESDKRTPSEALELSYPDKDGQRRPVHIPENLYIIGTMNIADRSLALFDMAFRRRFAFATLEPQLGDAWRTWVVEQGGVDPELAREIERRVTVLNHMIAAELGKPFCIGHSYVTPPHRLEAGSTKQWFMQVAKTEIGPLLDEYWFDAPETAQDALKKLIEGW